MDQMMFSVMRMMAFVVGLLGFAYILWDSTKHKEVKGLFLKLGFCVSLIIVGLLAGKMTSFKAGPGGFEMGFLEVQQAAEQLVINNPAIAEDITGKKNEEAVESALSKIRSARNAQELSSIISYEIENKAVTFKPKNSDAFQPVRMAIDTNRMERVAEPFSETRVGIVR